MQDKKRPYFSVVIPTKNRSQVIRGAIDSVLWQTFDDYELVIIDNDDTEATKQVIEQYDDPRIRYVRTGGLSMPDNWDAGVRAAQGIYVTVMADKNMFVPTALETIYKASQQTQRRIITWEQQTFHNGEGDGEGFLQPYSVTGDWFDIQTDTILGNFWVGTEKAFVEGRNRLPRGYNSMTHHSLVAEIIEHLGRVCTRVGPDYTLGFAQLALETAVYHVDDVLCLTSVKYSNGRNQILKRNQEAIWESFGGKDKFYNAVPVKMASLINNQIYNDFMNLQSKMGANLKKHSFNPFAYYVLLYIEMSQRMALGVDMTPELEAWNVALSAESEQVQQTVREAIHREPLSAWGKFKRAIKVQLHSLRTPKLKRYPTLLDAVQHQYMESFTSVSK